MARSVILEHALDDGRGHYDWMVEDATLVGEHRLRTWRVAVRPDRADAFDAEGISVHRAAYLTYEGPIGGDRGRVTRVAGGRVCACELSADHAELVIVWDDGSTFRYTGSVAGTGAVSAWWRFVRVG